MKYKAKSDYLVISSWPTKLDFELHGKYQSRQKIMTNKQREVCNLEPRQPQNDRYNQQRQGQ